MVQVRYQTDSAAGRAVLAKLATVNSLWNKAIPILERELSAKLGRTVKLLSGNYVKQSKGVVSYHGAVPIPGATYLQRKGYDAVKGEFYVWVVIK
ncbi:hypothetical protein V3W47_18950 [Deinococcus sp. YIM 134068]|uniref:hypothetical protein n=1 Tax=Deinococcus lichenicola TaxID=3118910 RepID=UPI002F94214D